MSLTGGCFCGQVRYRIDAPLGEGRCCHCSRCRKAFSGAGSAYSEVVPGSHSWTSGAENVRFYETAPGWGMGFCKTCGTTLCGVAGDTVHGVTLGTVDGDPGVVIGAHIFVDSKAPWDHIGGDAPQYAEHAPQRSNSANGEIN
ncbi:aldehyde-activating protein [Croceicoccus estronivorus]|uniref:GFA family protein n=1 Tax=Croceicoccus estronivorus TaxID=1172626 RepID=UPI0008351083|nr:GFA family protein [Croceicoccus estronivorus]OCC24795.1 aldehyde-activating protein [Croceicoccus estronivorus]